MNVIVSILPILIIISFFLLITYAAKRYKDGRKSTVMGVVLVLVGAFILVAQFVGSNQLEFYNRYAIIVSLAQIVPGLILIFLGWKLFKARRTNN